MFTVTLDTLEVGRHADINGARDHMNALCDRHSQYIEPQDRCYPIVVFSFTNEDCTAGNFTINTEAGE